MSIKPAPIKKQTIYNANNFFKDGSSLLNTGNQRLQGTMQITGSNITYGDEITYGKDTSQTEPYVLTISSPNNLENNQLVTKSYVDSMINPYPQVFTYGQAYSGTPLEPPPSRLIRIKYLDNTPKVQSLYIQVIYDIQRANANQITRDSAIQRVSIYNVYFYKNDNDVFFHAYVELIDGDDIHRPFGGGSYQPIRFGTGGGGNCVIRYEFPPVDNDNPNNMSSDGWLSSYCISFKILSSVPTGITPETTLSQSNSGGAYFEW